MPGIGATVGDYRLERVIGRGGMGLVYEAFQPALERSVALKVIDPERAGDAGLRARFEREARLAAMLEHPNVLPVFAAGEDGGVLYLAMRLVRGTDLRALVRENGPLAPARAAAILAQVAAALDAAHARGLVHRDVKPANVLVDETDHAYLTDFGIARRYDTESDLTRSGGGWVGSAGYVAPEQMEGAAPAPPADVYALGATAFHVLAGHPPGETERTSVCDEPPRLSSAVGHLPPALDDVLARALARDPSDRPRAGELAAQLAAALDASDATAAPTGTGESRGETRKLVTALVAELSGETADGEPLDAEALEWVLARGRAAAEAALSAYPATVRSPGDGGILAVFGAPAAREDDALLAVRAALGVCEAVAAASADLGVRRAYARAGVQTGEALVGGERLAGDLPAAAARLAAHATPGEVLISQATLTLVGDAVEATPVEMRGSREGAFAVTRLTERRDAGAQGPLLGRDEDLADLDRAYRRAAEGRRAVLCTVLGEAGVGKSRLAAELCARHASEALAVGGRCLSYGEGLTLWPLAEVVRQVAGEHPIAALTELLDEPRAEQIAGALGLEGRATVLEESFPAFAALFAALAAERPVIAVFDDVHWAQETLLDAVEHLADRVRDAPLLLVCLARGELLEDRPGWGGGRREAITLSLRPLSPSDSEALVNALGPPLEPERRAEAVRAAEGNPLFLEQLVALSRQGGPAVVPPTIQALLAARLDRLDAGQRAVLQRASIVGRDFWRDAVHALSPEPEHAGLDQRLRELDARELVRPERTDGAFSFRHILIRDAAYASIPKEVRSELHARFAGWLEGAASEQDEIVGFHLEQAHRMRVEVGDADAAARALGEAAAARLAAAARVSLAREDVPAAARLLHRAVALLEPDAPARPVVLAELSLAYIDLADLDGAAAVFEEVRASVEGGREPPGSEPLALAATAERVAVALEARGDARAAALSLLVAGDLALSGARYARAADALERARGLARAAGDVRLEARVLASLGAVLSNGPMPFDEVAAAVEGYLAWARDHGLHNLEATMLDGLAGVEGRRGDVARARSLSAAADDAAPRADGGRQVAKAERWAGDLAAADRAMRAAMEAVGALGYDDYRGILAAELAVIEAEAGRLDEAAAHAEEAGALSAGAVGWSVLPRRLALIAVRTRQGATAEAEALAREALGLLEGTDWQPMRAEVLLALAEALHAGGRAAEARATAAEAAAVARAKGYAPLAARAEALYAAIPLK